MLPEYFYHGIAFEFTDFVRKHGIQPYNEIEKIKPLTMDEVNSRSWNQGIYLSDYMALPFAWGYTYEGPMNDSPGLIARIRQQHVNEDLLRPGQWYLIKYLEETKNSEYHSALDSYPDVMKTEANLEYVQFSIINHYLDKFACLWPASLKETGEVIYRGGFAASDCEFAVAPQISQNLFRFVREPTPEERQAHLNILNTLDFD